MPALVVESEWEPESTAQFREAAMPSDRAEFSADQSEQASASARQLAAPEAEQQGAARREQQPELPLAPVTGT
jgi:hypothetical protein